GQGQPRRSSARNALLPDHPPVLSAAAIGGRERRGHPAAAVLRTESESETHAHPRMAATDRDRLAERSVGRPPDKRSCLANGGPPGQIVQDDCARILAAVSVV